MSNENLNPLCYHCGSVATENVILQTVKNAKKGEAKRFVTSQNTFDKPKIFCCNGCRSAFLFIQGAGLEKYYENRDEYAPRVNSDQNFKNQKESDQLRYEIFQKSLKPDSEGFYSSSFFVEGLHCASCVWLSEKVLEKIPAIINVNIQLVSGILFLRWSPQIHLAEIAAQLLKLGYRLNPTSKDSLPESDNSLLKKMVTAGFFAGNNMLISIALFAGFFSSMDVYTKMLFHFVSALLSTPVLFYSASDFYRRAWHSLKHRAITMDLLLAIGLGLAYAYSIIITLVPSLSAKYEVYFDTVCFVTFAVLVGHYLENKLQLRGKQFAARLLVRLPEVATRVTGKQKKKKYTAIAATEIRSGDIIFYEAEAILHCDGILESANAEVDLAVVTGESRIVHKNKGDYILAGAKIVGSAIEVRAQNTMEQSSLVKIKDMVQGAMQQKTQSLELAARYSQVFVVFVLLASITTFLFAIFYFDSSLNDALLRTLTMLLVACPCALNLAIPTAHSAAIQHCLKNNILIKNVSAFNQLSKVKTVFLDKTGTLTMGNPKVVFYKILRKNSLIKTDRQLLCFATAMEQNHGGTHPFAKAFREICPPDEYGFWLSKIKSSYYVPGNGIFVATKEAVFFLGSTRILKHLNKITGDAESLPVHEKSVEGTVIVLLKFSAKISKFSGAETIQSFLDKNKLTQAYGEFSGTIHLTDLVKPEAEAVIQDLKKNYKLVLLSGDNSRAVASLAQKLGINTFYGDLTPHDKVAIIAAEKKSSAQPIAMLGDGVNDAMALAEADIGISFAHASDLSVYSADLLLMGIDLNQLRILFQTSRKSHNIINQNLLMSIGYNFFLLPLAAAGKIIPLIGSLAMSLSSVVVVANSLRILRKKDK